MLKKLRQWRTVHIGREHEAEVTESFKIVKLVFWSCHRVKVLLFELTDFMWRNFVRKSFQRVEQTKDQLTPIINRFLS